MADRAELLEATLDSFPEGLALLGDDCDVVFWNHAAEAESDATLAEFLERAKTAMLSSHQAGGSKTTPALGGHSCSPS